MIFIYKLTSNYPAHITVIQYLFKGPSAASVWADTCVNVQRVSDRCVFAVCDSWHGRVPGEAEDSGSGWSGRGLGSHQDPGAIGRGRWDSCTSPIYCVVPRLYSRSAICNPSSVQPVSLCFCVQWSRKLTTSLLKMVLWPIKRESYTLSR